MDTGTFYLFFFLNFEWMKPKLVFLIKNHNLSLPLTTWYFAPKPNQTTVHSADTWKLNPKETFLRKFRPICGLQKHWPTLLKLIPVIGSVRHTIIYACETFRKLEEKKKSPPNTKSAEIMNSHKQMFSSCIRFKHLVNTWYKSWVCISHC